MKSKKETIFVLHPHDGDKQVWNEINREEFVTWQQDGSINDGALIVFPKKVMQAKLRKVIEIGERKDKEA